MAYHKIDEIPSIYESKSAKEDRQKKFKKIYSAIGLGLFVFFLVVLVKLW